MAFKVECGLPEKNETRALEILARDLPDNWALFTNIPRHLTGAGVRGREIDALAISPRGAVVVELKHYAGEITITPLGEWMVGGTMLVDQRGATIYPLQQAGKAAQILKSALGPAVKGVYIESCAIATGPGARISFSDHSRPQAVENLFGAARLVEKLASTTRGVPYPALQAVFNLVGRPLPTELGHVWRAEASPLPSHERTPASAPPASSSFVQTPPKEEEKVKKTQEYVSPVKNKKKYSGVYYLSFSIILAILFSITYKNYPDSRNYEGSLEEYAPKSANDSSFSIELDSSNTQDIWSTSVYSFAPGGGRPGGGLANEYLRVGGWGDEYVSLIKFDLPSGPCSRRAELRLFSLSDEGEPTPMQLHLIAEPWGWPSGDRLWWRDLPQSDEVVGYEVAAPKTNSWLNVDISKPYREWCTGARRNFGIMLRPIRTDHRFNRFASTRYPDINYRPKLIIMR